MASPGPSPRALFPIFDRQPSPRYPPAKREGMMRQLANASALLIAGFITTAIVSAPALSQQNVAPVPGSSPTLSDPAPRPAISAPPLPQAPSAAQTAPASKSPPPGVHTFEQRTLV